MSKEIIIYIELILQNKTYFDIKKSKWLHAKPLTCFYYNLNVWKNHYDHLPRAVPKIENFLMNHEAIKT